MTKQGLTQLHLGVESAKQNRELKNKNVYKTYTLACIRVHSWFKRGVLGG